MIPRRPFAPSAFFILLLALLLNACATGSFKTYTREFQDPPDIIWPKVVEQLKTQGEKIKKIDLTKKKAKVTRYILLRDLPEFAAQVPFGVMSDGEAEIEVWVEPSVSGGSLLKSRATIYTTAVEERQEWEEVPYMDHDKDQVYYDRRPVWRREIVPMALESNGVLEMTVLGYTQSAARSEIRTQTIKGEFERVKEIQSNGGGA